jgi:RNA polymerase sigma factor (sigma-70 family)
VTRASRWGAGFPLFLASDLLPIVLGTSSILLTCATMAALADRYRAAPHLFVVGFLPVGGMACGALAASGYYVAAWLAGRRPGLVARLVVTASSLIAFPTAAAGEASGIVGSGVTFVSWAGFVIGTAGVAHAVAIRWHCRRCRRFLQAPLKASILAPEADVARMFEEVAQRARAGRCAEAMAFARAGVHAGTGRRLTFAWSECRECRREQYRLQVATGPGALSGYGTCGQVDRGMSRNVAGLRVYRQEGERKRPMTTNTLSTVELLDRLRAGDMDARNRLVERALPGLMRFARGRLRAYGRAAGDTRDLAHDVIVRALPRLASFQSQGPGALLAFLKKAAANQIVDDARKARRYRETAEPIDYRPDGAPSPLTELVARERRQHVRAALATLSPSDRALLIERFSARQRYADIARILGRPSANAARVAADRAIARLAKALRRKDSVPRPLIVEETS